jgi:predicted transcriptional regulator
MEAKTFAVYVVIANHPKVGMTGIKNMTGLPAQDIRDQLKALIEEGRVIRKKEYRYQAKQMYKQLSLYGED